MTEGNFVDYVKINVFSGNGGKDLLILDEKNTLPKEALTVVTEEEGDMLFL